MRSSHYKLKGAQYGISHTRLRRVLELAGHRENQRVLDVACSRGYLGKKIKDMGNVVEGVEISTAAIGEAQKVLDKVYEFDIENSWPEEIKGNQYDLIILAEVLEHVFDPIHVLEEVRNLLNPDGQIIITTPNFMIWTNRLRFLFGKFKYQSEGMFDFGHIRFFTYDYLKEVLDKTNFQLIKKNHIIFPGKLTRILKFWPSLFAFQFIVKAKKT